MLTVGHLPRPGLPLWLLSIGAAALVLGLLSSEIALAVSVDEVSDRFARCGYHVGDPTTVYSIDGTPTTYFMIWAEDDRGIRSLVVYVYADPDAADGVFQVLATVDRAEGAHSEPSPDNGPLLGRGVGRSVWRDNVAVAQIIVPDSPDDLETVPDADLIRCLDGAA